MDTDLCTPADLEARLGRPLSPEEAARAGAAVSDASAVVMAVAPSVPLPPTTPDLVVGIVARLALQATMTEPAASGIASESLGGYSVSYNSTAASAVALSDVNLDLLRPWRRRRIGDIPIDPGTTAVVVGSPGPIPAVLP